MSLLLYILTLFFSVFFASMATKRIVYEKNILNISVANLFLSLSMIALLVGLRGAEVGTDTFYYIDEFYNRYNQFDFNNIFQNYLEPGHGIIAFFLNYIGSNHSIYLLTFSSLSLFFFFLFYKGKKEYLPWAIFFAFCIGFVFFMMNGLRQALAITIFALSVKHVTERNLYKFILIVLCASLFHYSALLMLPIYFINYFSRFGYKFWAILIIASIFISPFSSFELLKNVFSLLPKDYSSYLDIIDTGGSKFTMGFLYHLVLSFLSLYLSTKVYHN